MVTEQEGSSGAEVTARLKDGFIEVVAIERRACVERSVEERLTVTRTETLVSSPPNNELAMTGAIVAAPVMGAITGLVHATADKTPREELIEHSRQSVDCSKPIAHARVEAGGQVFKTNQWGRLRFRVPQTPVRGPWKVAVSGLSATPTALTLTVVDTRGDDLQ